MTPETTFELQTDFQREVLDESHRIPVLVDFWAEWCGPCRVLGPVLETLAHESKGRWKLVKVDTERHPEVARAYAIRGIPAVKLFHGGEPVAEFVGALPEAQVRAWLEENLPHASDGPLEAAQQAVAAGDRAAAVTALREALAVDPESMDARLLLARLSFPHDLDTVEEMIGAKSESDAVAPAAPSVEAASTEAVSTELAHLRHLVSLARRDPDALAATVPGGPSSARHAEAAARYAEAAVALREERFEAAVEAWIDVIEKDRALDDDGARRACIALFWLLGEGHPITRDWHRRFSSALF